MKKSLFTIALIIGIFTASFANHIDPVKGDSTKEKAPEKTLTLDEQVLLDQLDAELDVSLEEVLETIQPATITKVIVYDVAGNILQEQDKSISLDQLPKGANLLMTDGQTQYYLVD